MNLIQFKQVQGLSSALAQNTSYATAISGYLDGEIWTIMTGDSTFTGQKTFVGDVVFDNVVTGRSSGNFLGGLWVNTDKVLTQADTGTLFVTTVNSQNITGTKTFQGQGSSDNVIFKGGKVTIQKWGSVGETTPELGVSGSLFITGSDGAPFQITRNSPWLNASSDPANGDLYYSGTPTSVLPAQVGIGVIPSHMLDVDGVGNFKSVLADGISGHILSGKTGFLEELQVGAGLDNYWNSGSLVSPFISSTSGNFSSALTLGGQPIVTGSAGGSTAWSNGSSSAIYYNNGNVGIGTGVPTATLHVVGGGQVLQHENGAQAIFSFPGIGGDVKAAQLRLIDSSGDVGVNFISNDKYVFSGANVGIGTDTPSAPLEISTSNDEAIRITQASGLPWNYLSFYQGGVSKGLVGSNEGGALALAALNGENLQFQTAPGAGALTSDRLTILNSNGNVGIGTSLPNGPLEVLKGGAGHVDQLFLTNNNGTGDDSAGLVFSQAPATHHYAGIRGIFTDITAATEDAELAFYTSESGTYAEKVRIDNFGNVGIGTDSPTRNLTIGDGTESSWIKLAGVDGSYEVGASSITGPEKYFSIYDSEASGHRLVVSEAGNVNRGCGVGIGTVAPQAKLHVTGGKILAPSGDFAESLTISGQSVTQQVSAPASASSAGSPGQTSYDSSYFYVCVSADTWKRAALNTW